MDCCVLSSEEVGRLRNYKIAPNHEDHRHITIEEATKNVQDESMELVRGFNNRYYVTETKLHVLRSIKSGGIRVVQRVRGIPLKHLSPA